MEIFTKNSAKCTVFQSTICNKFSSLMWLSEINEVVLDLYMIQNYGPESACKGFFDVPLLREDNQMV